MIRLTLNTGNDAFKDDIHSEVARILRDASFKYAEGQTNFPMRDINGNTVGKLSTDDASHALNADLSLTIETDNAAFEDEGFEDEVARILASAADKVEETELDFTLRDINGNTVGRMSEVQRTPTPTRRLTPGGPSL
ncbi:hypothetical protein [Vogesella sp. XCS3]|uniref:hypothetical protein n=1 Tax=Vogesella sp. XCS3 TaxID=2877939 RepID=UPI001D0A2535|nr:hypothetical protein [Vogesella sp. XCS3]UDM18859.1 hypothetical protein LCH97_18490 [Vogesella sp. XCS3]